MKCQTPHSHVFESFITINLFGQLHLLHGLTEQRSGQISDQINIHVIPNNPISSIFDITQAKNKNIRLVYEGQILCPSLSFAFYKIQNKGKIIIIGPPKLQYSAYHSTPNLLTPNEIQSNEPYLASQNNISLSRLNSSQLSLSEMVRINHERVKRFVEEKCLDKLTEGNKDDVIRRFQDALNPITSLESARLTDIYRLRLEANSKSFRKLCSQYLQHFPS